MEHHLRMPCSEGIVKALNLTHITNDRHKLQLRVTLFQFQTDIMHGRLPIVKQDEALYSKTSQLATKL